MPGVSRRQPDEQPMRPADKLKLWTGGYVNMPGLSPPGALKLVQIVCFLSVIGSLVYGVFTILGHFGGDTAPASRRLIEAIVLFVFPFTLIYTISVNSPTSRYLFVLYGITSLYLVVQLAHSIPDSLYEPAVGVVLALFSIVTGWMFLSLRGRTYYLLISLKKIPKDLEHVVESLMSQSTVERLAQRVWDTFEPWSPLVIVILAIVFVVVGFANMNVPL